MSEPHIEMTTQPSQGPGSNSNQGQRPSSWKATSVTGSHKSTPGRRRTQRAATQGYSIPAGTTSTARPRGEPMEWKPEHVLQNILRVRRTDSGKLFPEFDDLGKLELTPSQRQRLLTTEAHRLTAIASDLTRPLSFMSESTMLKHGDAEGYRKLSGFGRQIKAANDICRLQNECISAVHCKKTRNPRNLANLIQRVEYFAETETAQISKDHRRALQDLVSYISAILTRLIVQTSPSRHWQLNVIGALVKRITMIKVILTDMNQIAGMAVRAARSTLENLPVDFEDSSGPLEEVDEEEECEEYLRQVMISEKNGTVAVGVKEIAQHCVDQNRLRGGLNKSLEKILGSMGFHVTSGLDPTAWEMCAVAYETGFKGFKALLYQDRDGEYAATSELDTMNTAHSAFDLLHQIVSHLKNIADLAQNQANLPDPDSDPERLKTSIGWDYDNGTRNRGSVDLENRETRLELANMNDIITVMVPLSTTSPGFLAEFTKFRHVIAQTGSILQDAPPTKEGKFVAFFRMYTSEFEKLEKWPDLFQLSKALETRRFSRTELRKSSQSATPWRLRLWNEPTPHELLDKWTKDMDDWVIDETTVTISCGLYVWSVIALSTALALGGLAIGFSVGERINGVDPSNLATYLWVLGAFVVLVGKSAKVGEWSWNDFLLRRVRCKSVSEIHSITGISPQHIIAKLLHEDSNESVLQTRGPYNSVFRNRQTGGFSIDVAIRQSTLLLSGLTMVKVATAKGHALVCLDYRRKTEIRYIVHRPRAQTEYLLCEDIAQTQENNDRAKLPSGQVKLRLSREKGFRWKGIQGIYGPEDEPEFV